MLVKFDAFLQHRRRTFCAPEYAKRAHFRAMLLAFGITLSSLIGGCSRGRPPPPPSPPLTEISEPPVREPDAKPVEATAFRTRIGRGAELYLPPWFRAERGGYDLIIHFHGEGRWQEANIERAELNAAVVSVNLGAGTDSYSKAFKASGAFERLLANTQEAVQQSGRAEGATLRRLALSAWSAGFSSIARALTDELMPRVDAILLADGFFTNFTNPKKRTVNTRGLKKFASFAEAAKRGEKLFALTHTTIPTGPYPSVQECVDRLLDMIHLSKSPAVATGPREMHQFYVVDEGSFHVRGFKGTRASDHVKQLHAMSETLYPWLKSRWAAQDETPPRQADEPTGAAPAPFR